MKRGDSRRPSQDEAIEATAAAWLAERDDGLTPGREAEFARWREADARHAAAVERLEAAWAALGQLRDFRPEARRHPDRDLLAGTGARTGRRAIAFPAIATAALAASLVLAAAGWIAADRSTSEPALRRYATTIDGYERVMLEDGSLLELNAQTEVDVRFTPGDRRVRLVRGEAHFTVAKNPARPFAVEAGAVAVRAIGTAFNVRLASSEVEVLVTEGKVEVKQNAESAAAAGPSRGARERGRPTLLVANERAIVAGAPAASVVPSVIVEKLAPDAVREALTWQGPRLVFVDTPLAEVVAQFNRRNQVQLELADAELGALPIGGSFRAENVDAFVRLLASGGDVVVERPDSARIVLRMAE